MLRILDMALAYPAREQRLSELETELALSRNQMRMYDRFFGFDRFRCDPGEPLARLTDRAAREVLARNPGQDDRLSHVLHCHTLMNTAVAGGETSDVLGGFRDRGLEVFSATMNHCATGVSMLGMLSHLLDEGQAALILIGEKAFHPAIRVIENTTIMGEAAAAILVAQEPARPARGSYEVLGTHVLHETSFWKNTGLRGEPYLEGFDTIYQDFACAGIARALQRFGREAGQIRMVMPHNVNLPSWFHIASATGLSRAQIQLSTIARYGHCFGADPFINLAETAASGALDPGDQVLLYSIGLGATASCALLQVN
ncbi:hypothetical protein KM176_20350 [Pseudooceanicola sp. CBS1P-1]|uniref:Beta-ketoacyl-[acyl-carrier-protein] synthase III C-terminal domain-containing protein n=1 Tax=Pseudooceanicola albus TaxID=2692189 RepID=A0A6L7GBW7_9RHOB|nr:MULTISPECIES: 3-oxoacyl-[acyl-carrier-protein] synthase III C-terminal domain-containing protein [Pseudooceanicola]MBT9386233.1 hypothetical protein [Pseudooceanicola endophyticus]MXN20283.1 hypothetical protein [Pseudooceanicola albus]